jgi:UDP-glucose 4-epimerase
VKRNWRDLPVGTLVVLEEAARPAAKKLTFINAAAIYGNDLTIPRIENVPVKPKNPYATSKNEGERALLLPDEGQLAIVSLRYSKK